jgi:hypothetical protein
VHGHDLDPAVVCSCCREPIQARDVTFEVKVNQALKQAS